MPKLFVIILLTSFMGWGGRVKVLESTSREWVGGLQESGYGTDYEITILAKAGSAVLKIEELWVGDLHMKFPAIAFDGGMPVKARAGMTLKPGADSKITLVGADSAKRPCNFKGSGLLVYRYKGKVQYVEIAEFKKLEKIIYPQ